MTSSVNSVEAFLASQKRFQCDRLNALLTRSQCDSNRKRVQSPMTDKILSCENCPGLGLPEGEVVANKKCVIPGCEKWRVINDKCTRHAREAGETKRIYSEEETRLMQEEKVEKMRVALAAKRAANKTATPVEKKTKPAKVWAAPVIKRTPVATVTAATVEPGVVLCDQGIEIDSLFREKRAQFLADLSGATSAESKAKIFLGMLNSLRGLVY